MKLSGIVRGLGLKLFETMNVTRLVFTCTINQPSLPEKDLDSFPRVRANETSLHGVTELTPLSIWLHGPTIG